MIRIFIENVIADGNIGVPINLDEIALRPETEYDADGNRVLFVLNGNTHIRIHQTGTILCMSGAKSEKSATDAILKVCKIVGFPFPKKINIKRIIAGVSFGKKVDLNDIRTGKYKTYLESDNCVVLRDSNKIHGKVFSTGNMVCNGIGLNEIISMVSDVGEMINVR